MLRRFIIVGSGSEDTRIPVAIVRLPWGKIRHQRCLQSFGNDAERGGARGQVLQRNPGTPYKRATTAPQAAILSWTSQAELGLE